MVVLGAKSALAQELARGEWLRAGLALLKTCSCPTGGMEKALVALVPSSYCVLLRLDKQLLTPLWYEIYLGP